MQLLLTMIKNNIKLTIIMKNEKLLKITVIFAFILQLIFSCSIGNETEDYVSDQKYFVELSMAKEIAGRIPFETRKGSIAYKGKNSNSAKKTIKTIHEIKNDKGKTSFYVINYDEGGFLLLSADRRTQPILRFSDYGNFEINELAYPSGLKFWMKDTKKQITDIQNSNIEQSETNKLAWEKAEISFSISNDEISSKPIDPLPDCYEHEVTTTVEPLLNSIWHQDGVFNDAIPSIICNGVSIEPLAGCGPIAMAQVMRYYERPTNYNWSLMSLTTGTTTTANFIKDIHDAIWIEDSNYPIYNCNRETGVSASVVVDVLKNQFNYTYASLANFNSDIIESQLLRNRPVIIAGQNGATGLGHMWVCDGFSQTTYYFDNCSGVVESPFFHMNWGYWNGTYNGYYLSTNLNPGNANYSNNKKMITI